MRSQHIWTSRDKDGRKREVRVTKFEATGSSRRNSRRRGMDILRCPAARMICATCAHHFPKDQRRRASAEDFAAVDKMLRDQSLNG